jgi:putative intracellular protease/amidase
MAETPGKPPADRHDSPNIEVSFPDSSDYDLLVVLGAPWAAYDDVGIGRWLTPELRWLSGVVAAGGAVLGICFGAQVLARALGGSVARSADPEIGWVRIDSDVPALIPAGPWSVVVVFVPGPVGGSRFPSFNPNSSFAVRSRHGQGSPLLRSFAGVPRWVRVYRLIWLLTVMVRSSGRQRYSVWLGAL